MIQFNCILSIYFGLIYEFHLDLLINLIICLIWLSKLSYLIRHTNAYPKAMFMTFEQWKHVT